MLLKNILTSYQLENYNNSRFLKFIYTHPKFWIFWWERQSLVWTKKAILIFLVWIFLAILDLVLALCFIQNYLNIFLIIFIFFIWILFLPIYLILANFLLIPVDRYLKKKIIEKAHNKILRLKKENNLKVIWITWSYGKTSQKEILKTLLKDSHKVLATSWNKNTPLWVSEIIINELDKSYQIFIVEMWAYRPWDIKELCDLVNPDIGILTWITLQHLERFKNLENIINTKFELIESLKPDSLAILDISNENIKLWLEKKEKNLKVKNIVKINSPENIKFLENLSWISFKYDSKNFETKLLAAHSANQIIIAYEVAKFLRIDDKFTKSFRTKKIDYIKHRLELIYNEKSDLYVIDDSYNWNIEWVKSTIFLLENIKDKRKIYLTPWLVELGKKSDEIHYNIWKNLANVIDKALLIENKSTKQIYNWLIEAWFKKENIVFYETTNKAHLDIKNQVKANDLIVFQNDWSDNYF